MRVVFDEDFFLCEPCMLARTHTTHSARTHPRIMHACSNNIFLDFTKIGLYL